MLPRFRLRTQRSILASSLNHKEGKGPPGERTVKVFILFVLNVKVNSCKGGEEILNFYARTMINSAAYAKMFSMC
jgi:hypothetical protein